MQDTFKQMFRQQAMDVPWPNLLTCVPMWLITEKKTGLVHPKYPRYVFIAR